MPRYRLYCENAEGYIEFADCVEAADDRAAILKTEYLKRNAVFSKVWEGERLVATIDHEAAG